MKLHFELTGTEYKELIAIIERRIMHTNSKAAVGLYKRFVSQYEYQRKRDNKTA